jgi:predicted GIY-YIG superfamily endonuclease
MSNTYKIYYVYWLYDETMLNPWLEGYIGISYDMNRRLHEHRKNKRHPDFKHRILHEVNSREEALKIEKSYRPFKATGWNFASGGVGPSVEWVMSPETIVKRKIYLARRWCLIGQIFGNLKVIKRGPDKPRKTGRGAITTQICQCMKCEEILEPIQSVHLRSGHTKNSGKHKCRAG